MVQRQVDLPVAQLAIDSSQEVLPQVEQEIAPENLYMDLTTAPLMQVKLADDVGNGVYYLIIKHHHLTLDHIGMAKVGVEVMHFLAGHGAMLPAPSLYRDFIGDTLNKDKLEDSKKYFGELYQSISEPTYPFGLSNTKIDGGVTIESAEGRLSAELTAGVRKVAGDLQISPAVMFHAAFGLVVAKCSNADYALFGSLFLGRLQGANGSDSSLGLFMNTLPVFLDMKGDIPTYLKHANDRLQELLNYEQTPVSQIHQLSDISNEVPMFSALLNYRHSAAEVPKTVTDFAGEVINAEQRTNYPFNFEIDDFGNDFGLRASGVGVDTANVLSYMEEAIRAIIEQMETDPSADAERLSVADLNILAEAERRQLLETFNKTSASHPVGQTLVDLFKSQADKAPEATAIVFEEEAISYKELDERSNQLAHYLIEKGVSTEDLVGVCLERGPALIISILGILKSGGAYVPIDPGYPEDRIQYMMEDAAIRVLLSTANIIDHLPELGVETVIQLDVEAEAIQIQPVQPTAVSMAADQLAYVIYTSGSTGRPKGVLIEHGSICNTIQGQIALFGLAGDDNCLQYASPSFDASVWEIFLSLLSGASLCIIDESQKYDIEYFVKYVEEQGITFSTLPPAFFKLLDVSQISGIKTMVTAGEEAPLKNAQLFAENGQYFNAYGPTETSICATIFKGVGETSVPIGSPIAKATAYLLNEASGLVPLGAVGELCVGGPGLARGYLNKEALTAERFIANPFKSGERLYRTGDLARWLPDGNLEFIGRKDDQVKVRGYRIELGEIENALSLIDGVQQSCVLARADSNGNNRLVAYVVTEGDQDEATWKESLQQQLNKRLPAYMVPQLWFRLDEMPLTTSGKVNKKALPDLDGSALSSTGYVAPRTETATKLALIWQELLGVEKVGVHDNFFELGGHSLLATRLVSMIRKELDIEVAIQEIFKFSTVDELAAYLEYKVVHFNDAMDENSMIDIEL